MNTISNTFVSSDRSSCGYHVPLYVGPGKATTFEIFTQPHSTVHRATTVALNPDNVINATQGNSSNVHNSSNNKKKLITKQAMQQKTNNQIINAAEALLKYDNINFMWHYTMHIALEQLHFSNYTATIALQQNVMHELFCKICTSTIVLE